MIGSNCLQAIDQLTTTYKTSCRALLDADPEFAAWLESEYVPIAGAWQY